MASITFTKNVHDPSDPSLEVKFNEFATNLSITKVVFFPFNQLSPDGVVEAQFMIMNIEYEEGSIGYALKIFTSKINSESSLDDSYNSWAKDISVLDTSFFPLTIITEDGTVKDQFICKCAVCFLK